jgi:hypothetical protein
MIQTFFKTTTTANNNNNYNYAMFQLLIPHPALNLLEPTLCLNAGMHSLPSLPLSCRAIPVFLPHQFEQSKQFSIIKDHSKMKIYATGALVKDFGILNVNCRPKETAIAWNLINTGVNFYHPQMFSKVANGLFALIKQAIISHCPQQQVMGSMNMAHKQNNNLDPTMSETYATIAAYTLLLLCTSSSGPVLTHYVDKLAQKVQKSSSRLYLM